eukprot:1747455-Prymnesium_polylepis.2
MRTPLWLAMQLGRPGLVPPQPERSAVYAATQRSAVYAATQPLIGGPPFLELHVCIRHGDLLVDFVPRRPTELGTAVGLLSGGDVDGQIRCRPAGKGADGDRWRLLGFSTRSNEDVEAFAREQRLALSLRSNNCWSFARAVVDYAIT